LSPLEFSLKRVPISNLIGHFLNNSASFIITYAYKFEKREERIIEFGKRYKHVTEKEDFLV